MQNYSYHQHINESVQSAKLDIINDDKPFFTRLVANSDSIFILFMELYEHHPTAEFYFNELITVIIKAHQLRSKELKTSDENKTKNIPWFLSNQLAGMSLYVDRFCGSLKTLEKKLDYFQNLGVNLLHLMPICKSPEVDSDGGYAVSDFRDIAPRFGTLNDLRSLQDTMRKEGMYLMLDIVLNHTSRQHEWALNAARGDKEYQDYYYFYNDRILPDQYEDSMPEIFPQAAPGNFTYVAEAKKWVMTVFHDYQWDLNYSNPKVFIVMMDTIFFYANLGVDILRIDAPAFIWKQLGTTCQNLPQVHKLLRLIKQCVQVSAPGMALLGEAIVAPRDIMPYFGTGDYIAKECDFAYNATQMALQWDMLATADTRVMLEAQSTLLQKPYGTSWINYTRSHDDIGLGYDDTMINRAGFNPFEHRTFLKNYYSGKYFNSPAKGALFSTNTRTGDARISGTLASLCGLETANDANDSSLKDIAINKILLQQAHSFFLGGLPILFCGDELGYTNDYSYLNDPGKSYDNRWMHRPMIDWSKNSLIEETGTNEERIFSATKRLLYLRRKLPAIGDYNNLTWLTPHNIHIAGFIREHDNSRIFCLFNFNKEESFLTWYVFKEKGNAAKRLFDHWKEEFYDVGEDSDYLIMAAYSFLLLEVVD